MSQSVPAIKLIIWVVGSRLFTPVRRTCECCEILIIYTCFINIDDSEVQYSNNFIFAFYETLMTIGVFSRSRKNSDNVVIYN